MDSIFQGEQVRLIFQYINFCIVAWEKAFVYNKAGINLVSVFVCDRKQISVYLGTYKSLVIELVLF